MAVSSYIIFPISATSSTSSSSRLSSSSKRVLIESRKAATGSFKVSTTPTICSRNQRRLRGCVRNSIFPDGTPIPSGSPDTWKSWIFGLLVTLIFPMWKNKLGPFALLKNKMDTAVQTAEDIAEAVETVAEKVDKLAEEVSEHLPEGGKLKHAFDVLEDLAEEISENAHLLGEVIDKVQEVEDDVEKFMEEHSAMGVAASASAQEVENEDSGPRTAAKNLHLHLD